MEPRNEIRIRRAEEGDAQIVDEYITRWLNFGIRRETMIMRAIDNKELLVADSQETIAGFIHYAMHTDIVDEA